MARKRRVTEQQDSRVSLLMLKPREVGAAEFKSRCLELIGEIEKLGGEIVITRHRKPVARLLPVQAKSPRFCGALKGAVLSEGDIVSPIDVEWTADEPNFT